MREHNARALVPPRISAFDVFDEDTWLRRVRNTLADAIVARHSPRRIRAGVSPVSAATPTKAARAAALQETHPERSEVDDSPADLVLVDCDDASVRPSVEEGDCSAQASGPESIEQVYSEDSQDDDAAAECDDYESGDEDVIVLEDDDDDESDIESVAQSTADDEHHVYGFESTPFARRANNIATGVRPECKASQGGEWSEREKEAGSEGEEEVEDEGGEEYQVGAEDDEFELYDHEYDHDEDAAYDEYDEEDYNSHGVIYDDVDIDGENMVNINHADFTDESVTDQVAQFLRIVKGKQPARDSESVIGEQGSYESSESDQESSESDSDQESDEESSKGSDKENKTQLVVDEHMRLTAEALKELFSHGGIRDGDTGDLVDTANFAANVVPVDEPPPPKAMSALELFSAFEERAGSSQIDLDELLRARANAQSIPDSSRRPVIEIISSEPTSAPDSAPVIENEGTTAADMTDRRPADSSQAIQSNPDRDTELVSDSADISGSASHYEDAEQSGFGRSLSQPIVVLDSDGKDGEDSMYFEPFAESWANNELNTNWDKMDLPSHFESSHAHVGSGLGNMHNEQLELINKDIFEHDTKDEGPALDGHLMSIENEDSAELLDTLDKSDKVIKVDDDDNAVTVDDDPRDTAVESAQVPSEQPTKEHSQEDDQPEHENQSEERHLEEQDTRNEASDAAPESSREVSHEAANSTKDDAAEIHAAPHNPQETPDTSLLGDIDLISNEDDEANISHATRSHCALRRLVLSRLPGAPTFVVHECALDPVKLEEEGATEEDIFLDTLDMKPLIAEELPEDVYHTLTRIVGLSMLDKVSVIPGSLGDQWMREAEAEEAQVEEAKAESRADDDKAEDEMVDASTEESGTVEAEDNEIRAAEDEAEIKSGNNVDEGDKEAEDAEESQDSEGAERDNQIVYAKQAGNIEEAEDSEQADQDAETDNIVDNGNAQDAGELEAAQVESDDSEQGDDDNADEDEDGELDDHADGAGNADHDTAMTDQKGEQSADEDINGIRAFRNALGARRMIYTMPSVAEIKAAEAEVQRNIEEATEEVVKLGFPRQGIYSHKVVWAEHDQFRHVNNVHYLRWFENARMVWLDDLTYRVSPQMRDDMVNGRNIGIILANTYCRYRRPVTFPDTILIGQAMLPITKPDRFTKKYIAYSVKERHVAAISEQEGVTYDYERLCKAPIPEELRVAFEAWQYTGK
ncbi:hypothetical protein MCUN1_003204 [Malassezia cuniculi]|uniref:Uncharacterized protein n=1 Tax=Malassezia cuniculi TaxID=948313 RepID=A0AAF0ET74_9BASI|nr:hypothetical protein MCUN1_003204 [Malassezia cuniculi]